jgi:hypothetical protein
MSEKIGDVPESEQNRENEKIFFLSFLYKEEREKKFFFRKRKIRNGTISPFRIFSFLMA